MNGINYIFNRKLLQSKLQNFSLSAIPDYEKKKLIVQRWKLSIENNDLFKTKEKSVQGDFLSDFFTNILGYQKRYGNKMWNISQEQKTLLDGTTPDAALGFFTSDTSDVRVVIELKDANTDLEKKQKNRESKMSPIDQAFLYASKSGKDCRWIIVSNFIEIRLYRNPIQLEYEKFVVKDLTDDDEFKRFYYLLCCEHLLDKDKPSYIENLYAQNEDEQQNISKHFYNDYKEARLRIFQGLKKYNPNKGEFLLFEKSQKLMDRFIFIRFCEGKELLQKNIFLDVIKTARKSFDTSNNKIWIQLKWLFDSIDMGNSDLNINRFNGGLFQRDNELDSLNVPDELFEVLERLTSYDFETDLNVNILGHIFEQNVSDIEEIKNNINGEKADKKQGKRKREGIFYTPEYITNYIVQQTIGTWLSDRKKELGEDYLPRIPEFKEKMTPGEKRIRNKIINRHLDFWKKYKDVLSNIKILDPACGSGAFLNQAFDYLYDEGQRVNIVLSELSRGQVNGQVSMFDLDKQILKNNLYGVDINKESVEITKLSLWLKTANKKDPLTSLDDNIKCGNSLIDDKKIAGDKVFKWEEEFDEIIKNGGFDIIIGNPPYVRVEYISKKIVDWYKQKYNSATGKFDLSSLFIEKSLGLLSAKGKYCIISSYQFIYSSSGSGLREFIVQNASIDLLKFSSEQQIFDGATTYTGIFLFSKENIGTIIIKEANISGRELIVFNTFELSKENFKSPKVVVSDSGIYNKIIIMKDIIMCSEIGSAKCGVVTSADEVFFVSGDRIENLKLEKEITPRILGPGDLFKWYLKEPEEFCIYPYTTNDGKTQLIDINTLKDKYPNIYNYFIDSEKRLKSRSQGRRDYSGSFNWYQLNRPREKWIYDSPKIIYPGTTNHPKFALDFDGKVFRNARLYAFVLNEISTDVYKYLLCIFNSSLSHYLMTIKCSPKNNNYFELSNNFIDEFPVVNMNSINIKSFVDRADNAIKLNKQLYESIRKFLYYISHAFNISAFTARMNKFYNLTFMQFVNEIRKAGVSLSRKDEFELMDLFESRKTVINEIISKIEENDRMINFMVYDLYRLSDNDVNIIENAARTGKYTNEPLRGLISG